MKLLKYLLISLLIISCEKKEDLITKQPLPSISSISFTKDKNPTLDKDIYLSLDGFMFSGKIGFIPPSLIADIEFDGDSIKSNGVLQISGISEINLLNDIKYTIYRGSDSVNYYVSLKRLNTLPVVNINTENQVAIDSKEDYVKCDIAVQGGEFFESFSVAGKIRGRGNSTWYIHPKKPYQLKTEDDVQMLGLPINDKWIFLAEHSDKTLMRNMLAFEMGRISALDFTPKGKYADVYLNNDYIGVYNICEKVEESDNRVNLKDSGYLCEIDQFDRLDPDDTYFYTGKFLVNIKDPGVDFDTPEFNTIKDHINEFEGVLMGNNFLDATNGYEKYVDLYSFADWFLINEILRNPDARSWSSIFFTYIPGEKIKMGPLWDFDLSLGNANYDGHENPQGFWVLYNPWIYRMYQDPEFKKVVRERFDYYNNNLADLMNFINNNYYYISDSHAANNQRWNVLGNWVWPNVVVYDTFEQELDYMKSFLRLRMSWLDLNLSH